MSDARKQDPMVELTALDELVVDVEKLVAGGDGLARYRGIAVFVPRTAPGDRVRVRLTERKPSYVRAEILELLRAGPDRRPPPCRHFQSCGGCDLQHLEDSAQLDFKVAAAREVLARIGGVDVAVPERVVAGEPWRYRLRTQLQVDGVPGAVRAGYFGRRSHDLVAIRECPVLVEPLERFAVGVGDLLRQRLPKRLDVAAGDGGRLTCGPALDGLPSGSVSRRVGEFEYEYDARIFFQAHAGLLEELVAAVVGTESGRSACDLYAGVGLFSLPLARRFGTVTAVESDRVAARYLRRNARKAKVPNLTVQAGSVESWLAATAADLDRVVVDPPRAGLSRHVRGSLRRLRPARLSYISCHPAALARDLASLARDFSLDSLTYVDLFPQTGHLEVVAQLRAA